VLFRETNGFVKPLRGFERRRHRRLPVEEHDMVIGVKRQEKRARQEPGRAGIKASATMSGALGSTMNILALGQEHREV